MILSADKFTINTAKSLSKDSETCMSCHEDKDLTMETDGKKISLYVDDAHFKTSVHSGGECSDCHVNYNAEEIPHSKVKAEVNCKSCHDNSMGLESSVHKSVNCYDCHTKHDIKTAKEIKKIQTANCLNCHKNKNISKFSGSIHAKKDIGCEGCHQGGHITKKIKKNEVENVCGKCHGKSSMATHNNIHQVVMKSGNKNTPVCTDCHGAHEIRINKVSIQTEACLKCHLNESLFPGEEKGSATFVKKYKTSIHGSIQKGEKEAASCADCHGDHITDNPDDPKFSTKKARLLETCGKCHSEVVAKFKKSKHGQELLKNNEKAPTCSDCHGEHDIKSTLHSDEFSKINIADKCLSCHKDGKLTHKNYKGEEELITDYKNSVHYKALEKGNIESATCSDCHGAHEMDKTDDPNSRIYKKNIAQTCGQTNCHVKEAAEYKGSIHDAGIMEDNNSDAPTCNTCHGNHVILTKKSDDKLAKSKSLIQLCSNCHSSVELTERNDLPLQVVKSYNESFHGLATRGGSVSEVANCESCHGNHDVKPSSDSTSTINKKNLPETCGKCHPGATEVLFTSKVHLTDLKQDSPWAFLIKSFYLIMITGLIGFMLLHNILDWRRKKKLKSSE